MINKDWLRSLKIGDAVAYGNGEIFPNYKFSKVSKISPTNQVITLECGKEFNAKYGDEHANTYRRKDHLIHPDLAQQKLDEYKALCDRRSKAEEVRNAIEAKIGGLNIQQLEKLEAFLNNL